MASQYVNGWAYANALEHYDAEQQVWAVQAANIAQRSNQRRRDTADCLDRYRKLGVIN